MSNQKDSVKVGWQRELEQYLNQVRQFDPKKWREAFDQRQRMEPFAPGTHDPGPMDINTLKQGEVGLFVSDGKVNAIVRECANPDPEGSFGFVGSFGEFTSPSSFAPGILVLRFDPKRLNGVSRETLSLFRWDMQTKSYRKVSASGPGSGGDYVWGGVTAPGTYAIIGLHAHPLVVRTVAVAENLSDLTSSIDVNLSQELKRGICALLMGSANLRKAIEEPQVLAGLTEGSWSRDFPNPLEAWKPNPGFLDVGDLIDRCPGMPPSGWPEGQLLPINLGWPGGWRPGHFIDPGWQNVGPINVSGCILQVTIDPGNHHRLYAAAADGGLWRLDDVTRYPAQTWVPLTDQNITLQTTAVAVSPSDTSVVYLGDASGSLLRSESRGDSWSPTTPLPHPDYIRKIIVSPTDRNWIYLVTNSGFWRSRNGGATWDNNAALYDGGSWAAIVDAAMDPGDESILYLAVRNRGLLKTYSHGDRWDTVLAWDLAHSYWTPPATVDSHSTMIKIGLGRLGTDSDRVLAVKFGEEVFVNQHGGRGQWLSKGMGGGSGQGDWDHVIAVDPFDNNVIIVGAQQLLRTHNGGENWDTIIGDYPIYPNHTDQQSIIFDYTQRNIVYLSNDGGVFRSSDGGINWQELNYGLVTGQFARTGIAGNVAITGQYHQGITGSTNLRSRRWSVLEGGGWEFSRIEGDPSHSGYFYILEDAPNFLCRSQYPNTGVGADIINPFGNFPAQCTAVDNRSSSNTLLVGSKSPGRPGCIMRALNGHMVAPSWTAEQGISLDCDQIVSIAFAPSHPGMAYAVSGSGRVFRKMDVNASDPWEARGQWNAVGVMQAAVNPLHEDRLYLLAANQVARSENAGVNWIAIQGNAQNTLPDAPSNRSLAVYPYDGLTIFLAQDIGVFVTPDEGNNWHTYNEALPNAFIVEILWSGNYLYAVTGGRGLWRRSPRLFY